LKANPDQPITALLEAIAKALVDHSDEVVVWALEGEQVTVVGAAGSHLGQKENNWQGR
jgi:predicted RNA-binding protein YlqC (UPF0109 family)